MASSAAPASSFAGRLVGLPLWAAPVGGAVTLSLFVLIPTAFDLRDPSTIAVLAPFAAADMTLLGLAGWYEGHRRREHLARIPGLPELWALEWPACLALIADVYTAQGYSVWVAGDGVATSAGPGAIDLELSRGGRRHLVQIRRWRDLEVGLAAVRELWEVTVDEKAQGATVITCGRFAAAAWDYAEDKALELVDGSRLNFLLAGAAPLSLRPEPA